MQTINLNMTSGGVPPVVHLSQFDYKKQYALVLYNGDEEYTIPTGATVAVCGTKRDKHPFYYDSTNEPDVVSFSGSTVTVTTPVQMTACNGNTPTEIKIEADGATLYSANYVMDIEKSALPSDEELSDIDVALIIKAIEGGEAVAGIDDKIAQATEILSHMNDNVEQSDKDVELANASATAAKTSETNAKASETAAAQSASEAKASAENNEKWANQSESYAVGGTSTRTGEDEDNSKYYKDLAKQYAAQAQAAVTGVSFTIVTSLPTTGADGVFYLISHEHGSGDSYDEYVWLKDQQKFERIGTTDVDLTDYVKRTDTATTAQAGTMSATDKAKLDCIATGATKVTVDDALSATSSNPVANKAIQSALDAIEENVNTKASSTDLSNLSKNVSTLATAVASKADKATTLAGYGIEDGATTDDIDTLTDAINSVEDTVATKADKTIASETTDGLMSSEMYSAIEIMAEKVSATQTEVNARPSTRKLSTQTLTAEGGTLTWTDESITDDSLIDVYASIPNIAPSAITQTGTTVTVTFDAQDAAFDVAIIVMN